MKNARLLFGILLIAGAIACSSHGQFLPGSSPYAAHRALGAPQATPTPQAIVTLGRLSGTSTKAGMFIRVQVAGGTVKPFLFDTGSQGLWVYYNAVGSGAVSTGVAATNTYGSNIVYDGMVYTGKLTFVDSNKGKLVTQTVPFVDVESAGCVPKTTCPATLNSTNCPKTAAHPPSNPGQAGVLCLEEGRKLFGTFGADLEPTIEPSGAKPGQKTQVLYNTLFGLGSYATSFMIDQTQLELGPKPNLYRDFTTILMEGLPQPYPTPLPNGAHQWLLHVHLCFNLGGYTRTPLCLPALFDTGASDVEFRGTPATTKTVPVYAPCGVLRKGIALTVSVESNGAAGNTIGSFNTGYTTNLDTARFLPEKKGQKAPYVNTGLTFFNRNEIFFDAIRGIVALHKLTKQGNVGTAPCTSGG